MKLNAQYSAVLQNELPPKEKDPGSFVLPCIIGNTTISNALTDLRASISVMPFSMYKRLGLGNPRPVNMVIEMVDRSMQSPKGIVENVLVKIHKFIFLVDFVILDVVEDNKVPIILGRPMLATAHARIDVFGGKFSDIIDNIEGPDNLEEFIMDDDLNEDLGNFLQDNNLFLNYEDAGDNPPSPNKSPSRNWNLVEEFQDSDNNLGIGIDNFVAIDNLWDNLDSRSLTNKQPLKP
ncbi:retrovirus-related pol polyprotein from transposon TNT 1-94 [Tanacetum coccineum]